MYVLYSTDPSSRVSMFLKFGIAHSDYINANYIRVSNCMCIVYEMTMSQ